MKVVRVKNQADCFDGSIMKEVQFDRPVTKEFIDFMGTKGELDYFPHFARPFFKVEVKGRYYLKGIENNSSASLILYKNQPENNLNVFLSTVTEFLD
jgi:hypothetical protein